MKYFNKNYQTVKYFNKGNNASKLIGSGKYANVDLVNTYVHQEEKKVKNALEK
jgi:hypothetical protein